MEIKEVGNSLVWIKASDYLPAAYEPFNGAELSRYVLVQYLSGEQGLDRVYYPHGAFGHSTVPRFVGKGYECKPEDEVEYWLDFTIPPTPDEED